ncbi:MAG: helix-turn-helix transcriptional regulator [Chlorobi bacterium]|nr:helix-turn-helix transcriptional regulator [Chlorobiota bacterium]
MINRIQMILKTKDLTPTRFADMIQVQRSGISHILSGRNKPSLDFMMKILSTYPEINPDWLLFGKGEMSRPSKKKKTKGENITGTENRGSVQMLKDEDPVEYKTALKQMKGKKEKGKSDIGKIIVFYTDNSFEEYSPR